MLRSRPSVRLCFALALAAAGLIGCDSPAPKTAGAPPDMRRLTDAQYHNIIADLFGESIVVAGHFDPVLRTEGLVAIGTRSARITPSGFEQYYFLARSISDQVVNTANRPNLVPCTPAAATAPDDACARQFFEGVGRLLYRRPLTKVEIETPVTAAHEVAASVHDFYEGLSTGLAGMMVSMKFLFVIDETQPDPDHAGAMRLTPYAKASRLSFFLWNTTPDDELLIAAAHGDLDTKRGLQHQIDRMIASHRFDKGVQAFFADFLDCDKFASLEKDPVIYPSFGLKVSEDSREALMRTITDRLVANDSDYRDLFTTRKTYVTGTLARIYHIPAGRPDGWTPYEFAENDPRAGIVTQIGFLAVNSHPGKSSPTLRGRAIRELLLCEKVPDPPGDVDFSKFNDPNSPNKTARERLTAHRTAEACAGCHKITDPIGLALENFDGIGQIRSTENGETIDPSGELDGLPYTNASGLGKAIHDDPATPTCLTNRLYAYAVGRAPNNQEKDLLTYFNKYFASEGYRVPQLMHRIAETDAFFAVSAPQGDTKVSSR